MREKKNLGDWGETLAADFLKDKGYLILERQYHCRYGEADLVSQKDNQLVFVEVKTRRNNRFGLPETAVNKIKIRKLYKTALVYLSKNNINHDNFRLDLIAIEINASGQPTIRHYENIGCNYSV